MIFLGAGELQGGVGGGEQVWREGFCSKCASGRVGQRGCFLSLE